MHINKLKRYKIIALIAAAGIGSRCSSIISKQYIKLAGKPVLFHTVRKLLANQYIDYVRVVINKSHENFYKEAISSIIDTKLLNPVYGGEIRQNSVKLGLESLQEINPDFVIIHDACRPFVSNALINNLTQFMINGQYAGVVPATKIENTMLIVNNDYIESTISRERLRTIQTPQIFNFKELLSCHQSNKKFSDDSSLMLEYKKCVAIINGEKNNFKLTTKEDIYMANFLLEEPKYRIGIGYDIHKFVKAQDNTKNFIRICGVEIEHNMAIEANSDGDVATHAIVDAILGALGCDDIGKYFPSNSPDWKDYNSSYFLSFAATKAKKKGYRVSNLDITIICEEPKISPCKTKMKQFISKMLEIDDEFVNIKATTAEKLGSIGRRKGIAAHASVLLYKLTSCTNFS
ncbi:2-C-methyl-D-erythritol 4-phosphate cytidylyltransferase [Wolbachia endosymbiont of Dipetalonema caudispina]|uniref:2-C-methyl-D-erythritol 4-phosphate cytidylyltransferase n=1 Tax=Wolbachia endosymbiont of Dipetalonema caudispina TaxID=1812112 RepID=UPI00158D762F|nr:2-C-methyl-D-erythritol 4-phosphate cytidylyltransferase [Wolbachia endosymbiont of Dipetalonema caudispina]MCV3769164.1 2-C-methyl-D-erythritol 4-phosphate cytidylyltransferase [Wolbachia pipientis]QKX00795.1 2-C-methyl-D-erythritol 4-phosphate cytidylyltransferase [Wolbachia endosymbiont of Dipetalonema caudispina]